VRDWASCARGEGRSFDAACSFFVAADGRITAVGFSQYPNYAIAFARYWALSWFAAPSEHPRRETSAIRDAAFSIA
jgi:hypothetical protein